jgi:hypothetical protein
VAALEAGNLRIGGRRSITYEGDHAHGGAGSVILSAATRTGLSAVRVGVRLVASAGSHALWWLDHNLGGRARSESAPDERS